MQLIMHRQVKEFIMKLDPYQQAAAYRLTDSLEHYGHTLDMPAAKPIGKGLWELRSQTKPAFRILYGFSGGIAILLHAFKKQRPALLNTEIELAQKRLRAYCE